MSVCPRVLARAAVLAVITLVTALSFSIVPQAVAVTTHKPLNDTRPVGSAPVEVDFPIEYFGVVADLATRSSHLSDEGRAPYGEVRFRVGGRWTSWQTLEQDGAQAAGQFTGALVGVDRADAYQVRNLPAAGHNWRAAAINTTDGPTLVVGHRRSDAAAAAPKCMSRADWGADESMSGWAHGDTRTYSPVQTLTVHHTAGPNDPDQDYAATMRAIYSYHVKSNGWSDIGYQYLVGGNGVVYEGRSAGDTPSRSCLYDGGDGSDFAHEAGTDRLVTGAHVDDYNTGNLGISVMGCFEPESTTCTGDPRPTTLAVDAVESELALLSTRHNLYPDGTVHYVNPVNQKTKDVPTISGHRDWESTECPGGNLYAQLPAIRANVAARVAGTTPMDSAVVAFKRQAQTVNEKGGVVQLAVTRSGNADVPTSVDYAATSGTATPDSDFALAAGRLDFAAGETTGTIALTIKDDNSREARETIGLSLSNPGAGTVLTSPESMTVVIAASDQRPDAQISTAQTSGYIGNNIYNATGYRQTKTLNARRTQTRVFYARVYNDGNVKNSIAVEGSAPASGSAVRYYTGTTDVTTAMRSAGGWKVSLEAGRFKVVKVQIKVLRRAAFDSLKPAKLSGTWTGDSTQMDLVKAVVKVVR